MEHSQFRGAILSIPRPAVLFSALTATSTGKTVVVTTKPLGVCDTNLIDVWPVGSVMKLTLVLET